MAGGSCFIRHFAVFARGRFSVILTKGLGNFDWVTSMEGGREAVFQNVCHRVSIWVHGNSRKYFFRRGVYACGELAE